MFKCVFPSAFQFELKHACFWIKVLYNVTSSSLPRSIKADFFFFRHGSSPQHFKILSNADGQYFLWPNKTFPSINKLIDHHRTVSIAREPRVTILLKDLQEVGVSCVVIRRICYCGIPFRLKKKKSNKNDILLHGQGFIYLKVWKEGFKKSGLWKNSGRSLIEVVFNRDSS